jgi:hypothetical protein
MASIYSHHFHISLPFSCVYIWCNFILKGKPIGVWNLETILRIIVKFCWFLLYNFVTCIGLCPFEFVYVYPLYTWDDFYFNLIFIFSLKK